MSKTKSKAAERTDSTVQSMRSLRRYQWFGFFATVLAIGGVGGWAAVTEISSAVVAPGSVVVEGSSKKVQHLEGGIVARINVRNFEKVSAGRQLLHLDDTEVKASLQITQAQLEELRARQARLVAERDGNAALALPDFVRAAEPNSHRALVWRGQINLLESRRSARLDKEKQLLDRIAQLEEVIKGVNAQLSAKHLQVSYIREELEGLLQLQEQQLVAKPRVLAQQREHARLEGERGQHLADIARTQSQISEVRLQLTESRQTLMSEVLTELRDVESKLSELVERENATTAKLRRLVVLAPITGVVHKLSVFTVGGVIAPGETVMEIVPNEAELVIEGQLEPNAIDQVAPGQEVFVRLTALDQRVTPELRGQVTYVSADVRQDSPQTPRYYAVRATLNPNEIEKLGNSKLVPGMPAELMIKRGDRTVLAFLVKPLRDQLSHAFKER